MEVFVVCFLFQSRRKKAHMLSCPSLLSPKVARCLLSKASPKMKSKQALTKLYLRKHLKSTTSSLCVTHKTWLSYSEISNYCNEILSERVKQCFLQFTHLDFLVNKAKGRWSTWISSNTAAHGTKPAQGKYTALSVL